MNEQYASIPRLPLIGAVIVQNEPVAERRVDNMMGRLIRNLHPAPKRCEDRLRMSAAQQSMRVKVVGDRKD
jgi:hypothetical protein